MSLSLYHSIYRNVVEPKSDKQQQKQTNKLALRERSSE